MSVERKVYDSDIRAKPLLKAVAENYARSYIGNFDMMIEIRLATENVGFIPPEYVRTALNCLRVDPLRRAEWIQVRDLVLDRYPAPTPVEIEEDSYEHDVHKERVVVPFERPAQKPARKPNFITVRGHTLAAYATTVNVGTAPVVHLTRRDIEVEWWRARIEHADGGWHFEGPLDFFKPKLRTLCHSWHGSYRLWTKIPTYHEAYGQYPRFADVNTLIKTCATCRRLFLDRTSNASRLSALWHNTATKETTT